MTHKRIMQVAALALLTGELFAGGGTRLPVIGARNQDLVTTDNSLKLTINITSKRFCVGDSEVSTMLLRLRLHYVNVGERPIILHKGSNVAPSILISRNVADALADKHELTLSLSVLPSMEPEIGEAQRLNGSFVVLRKGASFDTRAEVPIPFSFNDQSATSSAIRKGDHVLQIGVITWPESTALAERLGDKWKHRGYLWHSVVQSEPMPFKIDQQINFENCR